MSRVPAVLAAVLIGISAGGVFAQDVNLSGPWIVQWPNNTRNSMTLNVGDKKVRYFGTFESDDKSTCRVTGSYQASNRRVALQITCPNWDARLQGAVSPDGRSVSGSYQAFVDSSGQFTMTRK